jgi:hypothetical protein
MGFNKIVKVLCLGLALTLVGCATQNRQAYKKLRKNIQEKKIDSAIELVKSDKFYPEKRSKLLKLLELGNLHHIKGSYFQSLKSFDEAKELSDKLFTVSISKKALSAITNDNMDNYYGEIYERSIIRFYQALNHYMLYQGGKYESYSVTKKVKKDKKTVVKTKVIKEVVLSKNQKRTHLAGARASLLEWNALLDNYTKMSRGETTYKFDLASRIFGAFIHEQMGTTTDRNIAIGLYKDAKKVLFRNYNLYPSFNGKYKKFTKDYKKLPKMSKKTINKKYVKKTKYAKNLLAYLDQRIKALKARKKNNVTIVMQQGYVSEKTAKFIHFPIPVGLLSGGGMVAFAGKLLDSTRKTGPSITFELPQVAKKKIKKQVILVVKNEAGKVVKTTNAIIMNPISDIAYQTLDNKIGSTYAKIGARLVTKHVAAILAAHEIYKKQPNMAGQFAASVTYAAANKAIAASEQADLRFWSTLPHTLRMGSFSLKPGNYSLSIKYKEGKKTQENVWGKFSVKEKESKLMNLNVF